MPTKGEREAAPGTRGPFEELVPPKTLRFFLSRFLGLLFGPVLLQAGQEGKSIWDYFRLIFRALINDIIEQDEIGLMHGRTAVTFDESSRVNFGLDNVMIFKGTATTTLSECPPKEKLDKIKTKLEKEWEDFVKAINEMGPSMTVEKKSFTVKCEEKEEGGKKTATLTIEFDLKAD